MTLEDAILEVATSPETTVPFAGFAATAILQRADPDAVARERLDRRLWLRIGGGWATAEDWAELVS